MNLSIGAPIEPAVKKPPLVCADVNYYVIRIVRPNGQQDSPVLMKTGRGQSQPMLNRRLYTEWNLPLEIIKHLSSNPCATGAVPHMIKEAKGTIKPTVKTGGAIIWTDRPQACSKPVANSST